MGKSCYPHFFESLGDVSFDNDLTIKDATLIQRHLAKIEVFDYEKLLRADTSKDGEISIKDATKLQRVIAKLIESL